jgi:hypothetical protein
VTVLTSGYGAKMRQGCVDTYWCTTATVYEQHYVRGIGGSGYVEDGNMTLYLLHCRLALTVTRCALAGGR